MYFGDCCSCCESTREINTKIRVSAWTVRHNRRYIILFLTQHDGPIRTVKRYPHTHTICFTRSVYVKIDGWWRHKTAHDKWCLTCYILFLFTPDPIRLIDTYHLIRIIVDTHNWIMDIQNSIMDIVKSWISMIAKWIVITVNIEFVLQNLSDTVNAVVVAEGKHTRTQITIQYNQ